MQEETFGLIRKKGRAPHSSFHYLFIKVSLSLLLAVTSWAAYAQNYHCKTFQFNEHIILDSLPVEKSSISISPAIDYQWNETGTGIQLNADDADSVTICFRTISDAISRPFFLRDVRKYQEGSYTRQHRQRSAVLREDEIFSFGKVQSYGAITRGVTFGNRQNMFVNSSLNLQMDGQLTDDLNVSAVITDQNIPYQPEGNTQQIRDFDNVFIKLYNDQFELIAGDIVLENPVTDSYFLKYYKNVQGLSLKYGFNLNDRWKSQTQVSGSLAKGQFASAVVQPQEGVQGPYKLRGANGERFIIILANSEKVYLDGQLLQRGFDRDYVIDYNLGEITFSNSVVITQFSRIRVDYEYANQFYSRSNLSVNQEFSTENSKIYFNYYREKDNRAGTLAFELSDDDLDELRSLGDNRGIAQISGVDAVGHIDNAILYREKDTVDASGERQTTYEYSEDQDVAIFRLSFSEVSSGNGSYQLLNTSANGRIYAWVGQGNGAYEPVKVIPLPNQKQVFVAGWQTKLGAHEQFTQELAISGLDQNLYSSLGDGDNTGWAWKGQLSSKGRSLGFLPDYLVGAGLSFEFNHQDFSFIDRFRSVDYDRDWNYDVFADTLNSRQDQILSGTLDIRKDASNGLNYEIKTRNRSQVIDGVQQQLDVEQEIGLFQFTSTNFWLQNQPGTIRSEWVRSAQKLQLTDWVLRPGYTFSLDQNTTFVAETDSVLNTLMHFTSHNFFIESGDSLKATFRADYISRKDQLPLQGEMKPYTDADEIRFSIDSRAIDNHRFGAQLNYRKVRVERDTGQTDENLLGKVFWSGSFADRHISNDLTLTTANVRELKREFVFVSVATGEGTHTWRDENEDGMQDLNEFYEAVNADEKNYIKLFTPTDEYINAYQTTYVHTVDAKMPEHWRGGHPLLATLSRLAFNANLRYNFKTTASDFASRINPFGRSLTDQSLLSARNSNRYTLFFNRNAPGLGIDLTRSTQSNKSLLSGGYELKEKEEWQAAWRVGLGAVFVLRGKASTGSLLNDSDFLESRNFELGQQSMEGEVVWQPLENFRLITGYGRRYKQNVANELNEHADINEYKIETTWVRNGQGNLNASFNWLEINFEGEPNTYLGYELLEALQPGTNQRWNVNWQQSLSNGLQLSLQYFGRKSTDNAAIHTGTVQVTAYF